MERALNLEPAAADPAAEKVELVYRYIRDHLHEKLIISDIARHIGLGERQLQRIVSSRTGFSITALLSKERIERSRKLLTDPSLATLTVAEIASRVGIHDLKRFHRLFKQTTNVTPARFRQEQGALRRRI
jgi:AraC family L-rhamnose operon transcriptional activator RhaR